MSSWLRTVVYCTLLVSAISEVSAWGFSLTFQNNAQNYKITRTQLSWDYMDDPPQIPQELTGQSATFGFNFKCGGGFSSTTSTLTLGWAVQCPDQVYTYTVRASLYCQHELWSQTWAEPGTLTVTASAGGYPCAPFSLPPNTKFYSGGYTITINNFGLGGTSGSVSTPPVHFMDSREGTAVFDPVLELEHAQPLMNGPCQGRYLAPTASKSACLLSSGRCCSATKGGIGVDVADLPTPCAFCYGGPPALLHVHVTNTMIPPEPMVNQCSCQTTFVGTCNLRVNSCTPGHAPHCAFNGKYCTCQCM